MWFKNLMVFQFEETPNINEEILTQGLEQDRFTSCDPQQPSSIGWDTPMEAFSSQLFHAGSGMFLLTAKREERLLPTTVVREAVNEKVIQIEQREARKVGRKQKIELRDELIFEMMPRAFTRSTRMQGLILPKEKLLVVDSASRSKAEDWVSLLRQSLGSLPVKPIALTRSIPDQFTSWLNGKSNIPKPIAIADECELRSMDETGAVIRCRYQDLTGDEIKVHLEAGKIVTRLAIDWNESLSFVLNEAAEIKRLRFSDTLVEQVEVEGVADEAAEFDARFALMSLEISRFLPALWETLGGLEDD